MVSVAAGWEFEFDSDSEICQSTSLDLNFVANSNPGDPFVPEQSW